MMGIAVLVPVCLTNVEKLGKKYMFSGSLHFQTVHASYL
jgi:hypothetical protein